MTEPTADPNPRANRPSVLVLLTFGLLGLLAAEALAGVSVVMAAPERLFGELIGVVGLTLLPFLAPLCIRHGARRPWGRAVAGALGAVALAFVPAFLIAMALPEAPLEVVARTGGLALLGAATGMAVLAPATVYVALRHDPDPMVVVALAAGCALLPLPFVAGPLLALFMLLRRSLVDRMP